jgi:sarcosine oxidase subunit beta
LPDLLLVVVVLNKKTSRPRLASSNAGVARENDAILGFGEPDNFGVLVRVGVGDIETHHTQPPRELSHHHVCDELNHRMITMKNTAEVVIVGGGIIGLSIAYHLAGRGMKDVVVLEKEEMVGMGSTGRGAGGFRHQFSTEVNIRLSLLSIGKLERFEAELDQPIDFHQDGYLFLLKDAGDVEMFKKGVDLQRKFGIPVDLLRPEDIAHVLPDVELTLDDIVAATYCAKDGVSDPAGVTEGYRKNAARLGVAIHTGQEVVAINVKGGRVTGVSTRHHEISAPIVVNAAGPYAGAIGKLAGADVPVVPLRRFIWTTKPFDKAPKRWTLVIDFSTGFYFHRESGGVLFGMPNRQEPPTFDLSVDWTFFETVMETAMHRFPPIGETAIKNAWAGSYEASPDAHPILGRVPGVEGFILANGFSGHGFQHAPGVGQLIAEEILDGRAHTLDISRLSVERFSGGATEVEKNVV